jgi:hypothetical protein
MQRLCNVRGESKDTKSGFGGRARHLLSGNLLSVGVKQPGT